MTIKDTDLLGNEREMNKDRLKSGKYDQIDRISPTINVLEEM